MLATPLMLAWISGTVFAKTSGFELASLSCSVTVIVSADEVKFGNAGHPMRNRPSRH